MLRSFVGKIEKSLSIFIPRRTALRHFDEDQTVPDDVVEGHFAVLAIKDDETKRFLVKLDYLTDPAFLGLLDKAREEFGFRQKGALAVPCKPQELQKILDDRKQRVPMTEASEKKLQHLLWLRAFGDGSNMFHILSTQTAESNVSKTSAKP